MMADFLTRDRRSWLMSRVRGKNTKPELVVRSAAHRLGYRFRLHRKDLPGRPDLVFPRLRKAVFVHGCFWHRHEGCKKATTPGSNVDYWHKKFAENVERDNKAVAELTRMGWALMIVRECQTTDVDSISQSLRAFLGH
jgi:DNA mismatch endonuclease (patch repair protein)